MQIQNIPTENLVEYARNPRKNDAVVDKMVACIKEFGFRIPIVAKSDGTVVDGHLRLKAARKMGLKEVPVVNADDLTEAQIKAFRLVANQSANWAEWDEELLKLEFKDLEDLNYDLELTGFDLEDIQKQLDELEGKTVEEDDFDESEISQDETPVITKPGDLWILGDHCLLCGDATKTEDIEKLIKSAQVDLVLTDPPYGISIVKNNNIGGDAKTHFGTIGGKNLVKATKYAPIKNDDTTKTAELSYKNVTAFSKNQIIFGGNYFTDFLPPRSCWLVWDKENSGNFADVELAWTSFNKGAVLYKWLWNGLCRKGNREIEGKNRVHPTQKPVGLLSDILRDFSKSGEAILDVFGGSGSTLIACEQLKRKCYMMELEPRYCDVIIRRWQKLTGRAAVLEATGKTFDEMEENAE